MVTLVTDNEDGFELQINDNIATFPPRPTTLNSSEYTQICLQSPETLVDSRKVDNDQEE